MMGVGGGIAGCFCTQIVQDAVPETTTAQAASARAVIIFKGLAPDRLLPERALPPAATRSAVFVQFRFAFCRSFRCGGG